MDLSVIILNYKMEGLVKNCIKAVRENLHGLEYEIIVVDNASGDKIGEWLKSNQPDVKFIVSSVNNGMGAGNNLGIREAKGDYILILNPDIFIFYYAVKKLIDFCRENPNIGLVSPRLLNGDKTLQHTVYRWHKFYTPLVRRTPFGKTKFGQKELNRFLMLDWDHSLTRQVDWAQGSCMLIPRKVFDSVGLFDERFFMYFEDTDLCRRIDLAGYRIMYFANAEVIHLHARQSDGGIIQIFLNKLTRTHIFSWLKYLWKWRKVID